jgi:hypothetical protein
MKSTGMKLLGYWADYDHATERFLWLKKAVTMIESLLFMAIFIRHTMLTGNYLI